MKKIFNVSDIITIVMEEVSTLEQKELYLIEDDEYNLPKPILDKVNSLDRYEFQEFTNKISIIAQKILEIKSGELNELNQCHLEISCLIKNVFGEEWIS